MRSARRYVCQGKSHSPEAWTAGGRETEHSKPVDKAIPGMVSELPGRSESERTGDPEILASEAEPSSVGRRQHETLHVADGSGSLRRGGSDGTATRAHWGNWRSPRRPVEKSAEAEVGPITAPTGKGPKGGRMEDGPVVAVKAGNAAGAKGPCRSESVVDNGRQG